LVVTEADRLLRNPDDRRRRLLRARGERKCRGSTKQGEEIAPSHELPSNEAHNLAHHCMRALCIAAKYSRLCRFRVKSVELGPSATFPLNPPEADIAADIILRRLVPKAAVSRCSNNNA
jgi:hypothetical protein